MSSAAYPCRLYLSGAVIPGDLHATNSVIVHSEAEEVSARANGYRKAYEPEPIEKQVSGGNGGSSAPDVFPIDQEKGDVAIASADPVVTEQALPVELDQPKRRGRPPKVRE
jgi:hypothetical protein